MRRKIGQLATTSLVILSLVTPNLVWAQKQSGEITEELVAKEAREILDTSSEEEIITATGDAISAETELIKDIFPDLELQSAIARRLGSHMDVSSPVSQEELDGINTLNVGAVTNWEGVQYLNNLEDVGLDISEPYDIVNLAGLANVPNDICIFDSGSEGYPATGDISFFASLPNLKGIVFYANDLTGDIGTLAGKDKLEQVLLDSRNLTGTLDTFSDMANLSYLRLGSPLITGDISSLSGNVGLEELWLWGTESIGGSLSSISGLVNLKDLIIEGTEIQGELSDLSEMDNLVEFTSNGYIGGSLESMNITDKPHLYVLQLYGPVTGDISALAGCQELWVLRLDAATSVEGDIAALGTCPELARIWLSGLNLTGDIGSLHTLDKLDSLGLVNTNISGKLGDLGIKEELYSVIIYDDCIRVYPADKLLFPKLDYDNGIFDAAELVESESKKTATINTLNSYIRLAFSQNGRLAGFSVNGVELSETNDYVYSDYWTEDAQSCIALTEYEQARLGAGIHNFKADFYHGGEVSGSFTLLNDSSISVSGISLNPANKTITVGSDFTITPKIVPENASNKTVLWQSSNSSVASVTDQGIVKGMNAGTAIITATAEDGGKIATCRVTVQPAVTKVAGIKLQVSSKTLNVGQQFTMVGTVSPANATNKSVQWETSNKAVATVNAKGVVKAVGPGQANITVKTVDGGFSAKCTLSVKQPVKTLNLNAESKTLSGKGKTYQLKAIVSPANATNKAVKWSSSNKKVAKVSSTGKVTVTGSKGKCTITCKAADGSGKKATCTINVGEPVKSVKLNIKSKVIKKGKKFTLKATINPDDATNKKVIWSSSNTSVATVNSKGVVKGIKKGKATITCKTQDGGKKATVTVKVN